MLISQYELDYLIEEVKSKQDIGICPAGNYFILYSLFQVGKTRGYVKKTGIRVIEIERINGQCFNIKAAVPVTSDLDPVLGVVNIYGIIEMKEMGTVFDAEGRPIGICKLTDFEEIKNFINS